MKSECKSRMFGAIRFFLLLFFCSFLFSSYTRAQVNNLYCGIPDSYLTSGTFSYPELAIDMDSTTYATFSPFGGNSSYSSIFINTGTSTDSVTIKLGKDGLITAADLAAITVSSDNNSTSNNDAISLNTTAANLKVRSDANNIYIIFAPAGPYNKINLTFPSSISNPLRIYYVVRLTPPPVISQPVISTIPGMSFPLVVKSPPNTSINWQGNFPDGLPQTSDGINYTIPGMTSSQTIFLQTFNTITGCGSLEKPSVRVQVVSSPLAFTNPPSITVYVGEYVTLTADHNIEAPLNYTWGIDKGDGKLTVIMDDQRDNYLFASNSNMLGIQNITADMNGYKYFCLISYYNGVIQSIPATLTVNRKEQRLTFTDTNDGNYKSAVYGEDTIRGGAYSNSPLPIRYTSSNVDVATINANGIVTTTGVGTAIIVASQNGDDTYAPARNISFTIKVAPRPISINAEPKTKVYGTTDPDLTYSVNGLIKNDKFTGVLSRDNGENAGSYTITQGSLSAGANYLIGFNSNKLTVTPAAITISAKPKTKIFGTPDPVLDYTVTGLSGNDQLTGTLSREVGENKGTYPITQGTLSAGSNYSINFTSSDFTISPAIVTVTPDPQTKGYGFADPAFTYTATGFVGTDKATGSLGRVAGEAIGSYTFTRGSLSVGDNYVLLLMLNDLKIIPRAITVTANAQTRAYGDPDPVFTYNTTGLVGNDQLTGTLSRNAGNNVGSYGITQGTLSAGNNYDLTFIGNNMNITPATLTITAAETTKTFGTTDPELTYTVKGLVGYDLVGGTLSRNLGENVGSYAITQGSVIANSNYVINFIGSNLTITPATLTVSAAAKSKFYGAPDPVFTYVTTGLLGNDQVSGTLSRNTGENAGDYAITPGSLTAGNNYKIVLNTSNLTIKPAFLTVTPESQNKVYGMPDPVLTYRTSGLIGNDQLTGALSRNTGEDVGYYAITPGTLSAGKNYDLTIFTNNLHITPAVLNVYADNKTKYYGEADPALTYTAVGLVNNDPITVPMNRSAGENIGQYFILGGPITASSNYVTTFYPGKLEILPAVLTVTSTPQSKVYGSKDPVHGYTVTGLANNDVITGSPGRSLGEDAGTYPTSIGSLSAGYNYTINFISSNFTITPLAVTVAAKANTKVYGTRDPSLTYTVSGLLNYDQLTGSLGRTAGENVGTYNITQGTLNGGKNYTIDFTSDLFTITKASQTITWTQVFNIGCNNEKTVGLNATSNSGLPIQYHLSGDNIANVSNATLTLNGSGNINLTASQPGDNNYEAATDVSKTIVIGQPSAIRQQQNNLLIFDNSSGNYLTWQWYKNDVSIPGANNAYYSDPAGLSGTYYVMATDNNGNNVRSCPVTATSMARSAGIRVSPNPVSKGSTATLNCNFTEEALTGAMLFISDLKGNIVDQIKTVHTVTTLTMPSNGGFYVITLQLTNGQKVTTNVIVN